MDLKEADAMGKGDSSPLKNLCVDEIFGNVFVITFTGYDTTADTLAFAILFQFRILRSRTASRRAL
jgi:hypothetical protein